MLNLLQAYLIICVFYLSYSYYNIIIQVIIKLRCQLLNSNNNQYWQNISTNPINIFHCDKRFSIIWTPRVYPVQNIYRNHLVFTTYIYAKLCFIKIPLIYWQYAKLINHCLICPKLSHQQLKIMRNFSDYSYRFLSNFKQVFLPV